MIATTTETSPTPSETITLACGSSLLIDAADRADLLARGFTRAWFVVKSANGTRYVKTKAPGTQTPITIARVLLSPQDGESVAYRDGNPLNLGRANLVLASVLRAETPRVKAAAAPRVARRPAARPPRPPRIPRTPNAARPTKTAEQIVAEVRARDVALTTAKAARRRAAIINGRVSCGRELPADIVLSLTPKERSMLPDCYGPELTGRPAPVEPDWAALQARCRAAADRRFPDDPEAAARYVETWGPGARGPMRSRTAMRFQYMVTDDATEL